MPSERVVELRGPAATHALAAEIGAALGEGDVVALVGELGAGKTEFVRGLAAFLRVPASVPVCSPSYLLLNQYRGGTLMLSHFDAYFMGPGDDAADDIERAGLAECRAAGIVAVEWADRVRAALPEDSLWIELQTPDADDAELRRAVVHPAEASS